MERLVTSENKYRPNDDLAYHTSTEPQVCRRCGLSSCDYMLASEFPNLEFVTNGRIKSLQDIRERLGKSLPGGQVPCKEVFSKTNVLLSHSTRCCFTPKWQNQQSQTDCANCSADDTWITSFSNSSVCEIN
jgi:hypothetical protein